MQKLNSFTQKTYGRIADAQIKIFCEQAEFRGAAFSSNVFIIQALMVVEPGCISKKNKKTTCRLFSRNNFSYNFSGCTTNKFGWEMIDLYLS